MLSCLDGLLNKPHTRRHGLCWKLECPPRTPRLRGWLPCVKCEPRDRGILSDTKSYDATTTSPLLCSFTRLNSLRCLDLISTVCNIVLKFVHVCLQSLAQATAQLDQRAATSESEIHHKRDSHFYVLFLISTWADSSSFTQQTDAEANHSIVWWFRF